MLKGIDYTLGHLMWSDFKSEIEAAFFDIDGELKLCRSLTVLHQTTSVAAYTKDFNRIALELCDLIPGDAALLAIYVEGLKSAV